MGNGAKAQQKRERNAKDAKAGASSQLKSNAAAKSIVCKSCKQTFLSTSGTTILNQHMESKHPKMKYEECFGA